MTDQQQAQRSGFLAAILEDPADDTPRLILADWLEENGQPERAEFIRVQCELANLGRVPLPGGGYVIRTGCPEDDARERILRRRERELLDQGLAWMDLRPPLRPTNRWYIDSRDFSPRIGSYASFVAKLHRGFVHTVTCTAAAWLQHADAIRACQPLEEVTLTTWPITALCESSSDGRRGDRIVGRYEIWRGRHNDNLSHTELVKKLLLLAWPRLVFHLPTGTAESADAFQDSDLQ